MKYVWRMIIMNNYTGPDPEKKLTYCCKSCGSSNVSQHALVTADIMIPVNDDVTPITLTDYSVRERGYYYCADCDTKWSKNEDGEWK